MTNLREFISHCGEFISNHPFLIEKFLKSAEPADPGNLAGKETDAAKTVT